MHEAKDQSFRYRKDLGLPNQVCLFRRKQNTIRTRPPKQGGIGTDKRACRKSNVADVKPRYRYPSGEWMH